MSDFLQCPRAYYLKNIYKDSVTGNKIQIVTPALSLGSAVHEVVEALSAIPTQDRFKKSLVETFEQAWKKYGGKSGGFFDPETEQEYRQQGSDMIRTIVENPGPLAKLSVKIQGDLPRYWLSQEDGIILCGKIDWLEYLPDTNGVHIIDFKTSKKEESGESLQLPIYHLLVHNTQKRSVERASYWYLRLKKELTPKELPDLEKAHDAVLTIAKKIKTAKKLGIFKCLNGSLGCHHCKPLETVLQGKAEFVGKGGYGRDLYVLPPVSQQLLEEDDGVLI